MLMPDMRVRLRSGPLVHLEGIIDRPASRADRVRLFVEIMNRRVAVEVDVHELEPA